LDKIQATKEIRSGKKKTILWVVRERKAQDRVSKLSCSPLTQYFLRIEEANWRQKGRAIWIQEGDNNKKFFHKFSIFLRTIKSIWEIKDDEGQKVTWQDKIVKEGKQIFASLFKEPTGFPITKILKVINIFPSYITNEMNLNLQEEMRRRKCFKSS